MNDISTICNLKDDKSCAVTFTTDDALYRSCLFYRSKFEEYGLRGTVAITADFVCPSTNSDITENNGYGNWEQWKACGQGIFRCRQSYKKSSLFG